MISTEGRCAREKTIIETDVLVVKSDPLRRKKEQVQVGRDRSRLHLVIRTVLRTGTYTIYDVVSLLGFKDLSRVGKVLVEAAVDEVIPPGVRSLRAKCIECLVPVAVSSLIAWLIRTRGRRHLFNKVSTGKTGWVSGSVFAVVHRIVRQAVVYRLFFRFGSSKYYLVSAIAVIISFFREDGWRDLFRLSKWTSHICLRQGTTAMIRSILYSLAFIIPFDRLWTGFEKSRRNSNAKKLTYFICTALFSQLWLCVNTDRARQKLWISPLKKLPGIPA